MGKQLPPSIGLDVNKPLLHNPYQQDFLAARRMRFCQICKKVGSTGDDGLFRCQAGCGNVYSDATSAPRVFRRFGIFSGRRGGKTVIGAHAGREESLVPRTVGWVCGPTYKILEDSTMPTFLKLIPPHWVKDWAGDKLNLTLVNDSVIKFRSLDDPERGRGDGPHWAWFDEASMMLERAWDVFRPSLTENRGACWFTTSPAGYDWVYKRLYKPAIIEPKPGFWACKYRTIDNPWIAQNAPEEVEEARQTMAPQLFQQEYEAEFVNFTGSVYGDLIERNLLSDVAAIKEYIPEWPAVDQSRRILIGLDSGADHPFGAVFLVVTEKAILICYDYLERDRAYASHLAGIKFAFPPLQGRSILWAANQNERQLRNEFSAHGVHVAPAENNQEAGIQRVMSWLYTGQLKICFTAARTMEQMRTLRYQNNMTSDLQKKEHEKVFKLEDELPDCVRYALMTWPALPVIENILEGRDIKHYDEKTQSDLLKMRRAMGKQDGEKDLKSADKEYPTGDFWGHQGDGDSETVGVW